MCKEDFNSQNKLTNVQSNPLNLESITENMESNSDEVLEIKKLSGGSLIEHRPVFSRDGECIFIVCHDVVKCYNTVTAEWVRDLNPESGNAVVGVEIDKAQRSRLLICDSAGELSHWQWKTGLLETKKVLSLSGLQPRVMSFDLVFFNNSALISWCNGDNGIPSVAIINYVKNTVVFKYNFELKASSFSVALAAKGLNYFCIVQGSRLFIVDIQSTKGPRFHINQNRDHFTTVVCHPEHDTIATGDVKGRIRLWRNVLSSEGKPKIDLYHWHHTPVASLAFTCSGTMFYSGGTEAVLVKWVINEPHNRSFLPRMSAAIGHVAVSGENTKIVVATKDNAIQFFDAQLNLLSMIQNFTWMPNDYTGVNPFPVGLQVNPRTQSIVLNGRSGHLQFFSTHTNSLLYNLDVTSQNYQCPEQNKVLFNTRVTQCALNINWMATSETWDDFQHTPEVRLKFWAYNEAKQSFILNTNVEMPHDKGVNKIQFSSTHSIKNLLCASVGKDNTLKIWAQEDSKNIYRQGKVWMCIAVLSYKSRPIHSTAFSSDCSLLAAGFGSTLCIFDTETFKMKCALTAPNAIDGSSNKVQISLGLEKKASKSKESPFSKRDFYVSQIRKLFKNEKHELLKDVTLERKRCVTLRRMKALEKLSSTQKESVFKQILRSPDLSFEQKVHTLHTLGLSYDVMDAMKREIASLLYKRRVTVKNVLKEVPSGLRKLKRLEKFQKLASYSLLQQRRVKQQDPVHSLKWFEHFMESQMSDHIKKPFKHKPDQDSNGSQQDLTPIKMPILIKNILFGNEDHCHLVCVCTDTCIMTWNLLNLRLQTSFNYSIKFACIDPQTNLIAAFSTENQLIVFHINSPLPVYQHTHMTDIYAMTWVPRRYPKARLSVVDWQAASQLYFLNTKQELIYIDSETNDGDSGKTKLYLNNLDERQPSYNTPFASIIANHTTNSARKEFQYWTSNQLGVAGTSVVKELKMFQAHTMAPLHLLGNNFILSLSKKSSETPFYPLTPDMKVETEENGEVTSSGFDEEEFDDESQEFLDRKELLLKMEAATNWKNKQSTSNETVISKGCFDLSL